VLLTFADDRAAELAMPQFIPAQAAAGGGGASFVFDGVTFTLGEYTAGSGTRNIDVELTLDGNAITSGNANVLFYVLDRNDLDSSTDPSSITYYWGQDVGIGIGSSGDSHLFWLVPATAGHLKATWTFGQDGADPKTFYVVIAMPDGSLVFSDSFLLPALTPP
jgi:hypothetical protein